jgi:3-phosphoglycerate kinase
MRCSVDQPPTGSKTILWNGPAGVFEFDNFAEGSKAMLDACIEACQKGATVIVGGGDTATVCKSKPCCYEKTRYGYRELVTD